jgi:hypothetical protein
MKVGDSYVPPKLLKELLPSDVDEEVTKSLQSEG